MLKETSLIQDLFAEELEEARAQVRAESLSEGRAEGARSLLLRQLRKRFGELPDDVLAQIDTMGLERCQELAERVLDAESLADLGLSGPPQPQNGPPT